MVTELRMARALRDAAAYRIAETIAEGGSPSYEDVAEFKRYRANHLKMLEEKKQS